MPIFSAAARRIASIRTSLGLTGHLEQQRPVPARGLAAEATAAAGPAGVMAPSKQELLRRVAQLVPDLAREKLLLSCWTGYVACHNPDRDRTACLCVQAA